MVVSTTWLDAHVNDPDVFVLHVGADRKSYDAGHIPGARFVSLPDIAVTREGTPNELPPATDLTRLFTRLGIGDRGRLVLYGDEQGLLAARLFFTLDYLGHGDRAALLDGGLEA
jgi:thiosulfate/3-mercaptopyruvate sulfurtransferase